MTCILTPRLLVVELLESEKVAKFGLFELNLQSGELRKAGARIKLQQQPYRILEMLIARAGELVTRDDIRRKLWPEHTFGDFEHGLNAAMGRLRQALGESAENPRFIETLARRGYRFIAPVQVSTPKRQELERAVPLIKYWKWAVLAAIAILAFAYARKGLRGTESASVAIVPLTSYPGNEVQPSFSPDGDHVVFSWDGGRSSNYDLYTKPIDSDRPVRLTSDPADDISPSWSPDGQTIAFLRLIPGHSAMLVSLPAAGGVERKLADLITPNERELKCVSWSPDGEWIATCDAENGESPSQIVLVSARTGVKRRLSYGPRVWGGEEVSPVISPDGNHLAFERRISPVVSDVYVLELSKALTSLEDARRITFWNRLSTSPVWTASGQEILFAGLEPRRGRRVWRVPAFRNSSVSEVEGFGEEAYSLALSFRKNRLIYAKRTEDLNIWRVPVLVTHKGRQVAPASPLVSSTRSEANPQYSPDGNYIAYQSERSGQSEIWICRSDGSAQRQLTYLNAAVSGFPRWSPDGRSIVFHSRPHGFAKIYVIDVETGTYRQLTTWAGNDIAPSWSRDGKWIYFGSPRNSSRQVWKVSAQGGEPVQVTKSGGEVALESPDGTMLYYSKKSEPGLWAMPVSGGAESQILSDSANIGAFAIVLDGVYFMVNRPEHGAVLKFLHTSTGKITELSSVGAPISFGLTVSPDGKSILYSRADQTGSDLILVENFR